MIDEPATQQPDQRQCAMFPAERTDGYGDAISCVETVAILGAGPGTVALAAHGFPWGEGHSLQVVHCEDPDPQIALFHRRRSLPCVGSAELAAAHPGGLPLVCADIVFVAARSLREPSPESPRGKGDADAGDEAAGPSRDERAQATASAERARALLDLARIHPSTQYVVALVDDVLGHSASCADALADAMRAAGRRVISLRLNAMHYGAPQYRVALAVVGVHAARANVKLPYPEVTHGEPGNLAGLPGFVTPRSVLGIEAVTLRSAIDRSQKTGKPAPMLDVDSPAPTVRMNGIGRARITPKAEGIELDDSHDSHMRVRRRYGRSLHPSELAILQGMPRTWDLPDDEGDAMAIVSTATPPELVRALLGALRLHDARAKALL